MSVSNLLDTKIITFNEILGNGKIYHVPQFQRDYSWEKDQLEDLWNDLLYLFTTPDEVHYMGAVVLQIKGNQNEKQFWIIDGQQRLTTLSILVLAVVKKLKDLVLSGTEPAANMERADLLMKQYIGQKDPSSLLYSSKLFLNENNDSFYQHRLVSFRAPVSIPKLSDSEKLLWKAYSYFCDQVNDLFEQEKNGEKIAQYLTKTAGESLKFIQITVADELNAFTVFETLNSRGVELTATDLLKNYLFSLVAKSNSDLQAVREQWNEIIKVIGLKNFPIFLLHYLNCMSPLVTKEQLFKAVKRKVKTDQDVLDILDHLQSYAYTYSALTAPEDELWLHDKDIQEDIHCLNLFKVTQCHPLLMIAKEKFPPGEFKKLLHGIVMISFRYNVIAQLPSNDMEKAYNKTAIKIFDGNITLAADAVNDLKEIYLPDEIFKDYFELRQFNTSSNQQKKIARYILYKIEGQLESGIKTNYQLDKGTIEHILPEKLDARWGEEFSEEKHQKYIYRLGNMTLLEPRLNQKEAGQKPFEEKKSIYAKSKYALSREIANKWENWDINKIRFRQIDLAKVATSIWKK